MATGHAIDAPLIPMRLAERQRDATHFAQFLGAVISALLVNPALLNGGKRGADWDIEITIPAHQDCFGSNRVHQKLEHRQLLLARTTQLSCEGRWEPLTHHCRNAALVTRSTLVRLYAHSKPRILTTCRHPMQPPYSQNAPKK